MGASTKETRTSIAGAKHREEERTDKSTFLSKLATQEDRVTITRLDKQLTWILNLARKTSQEIPLLPATATEPAPSADESESASSDEKPTTRVTKAEFKVEPGKNKKVINGF